MFWESLAELTPELTFTAELCRAIPILRVRAVWRRQAPILNSDPNLTQMGSAAPDSARESLKIEKYSRARQSPTQLL